LPTVDAGKSAKDQGKTSLFITWESHNMMSNISLVKFIVIAAREMFIAESRRVKTGLMDERDRTVTRSTLNSLEAAFATSLEETNEQSPSPEQRTSSSSKPHYVTTAQTFEEKQRLSNSTPGTIQSSDQQPKKYPNKKAPSSGESEDKEDNSNQYVMERIKSIVLNENGTEVEFYEVKWEGFRDWQNTYESFDNLSVEQKPLANDLAARVSQV
jgi:hypothetical protein